MIGKYKYDFNIPQDVRDLLNKLHTKYEAYIVGGCVRDLLLNEIPKDYDITTNATPQQIKELFEGYELINNNGEKHGTVTVRYNNENYEITTYRIDGEYSDNRHPDSVSFTSNLQEDLSRRDFTINALVYDGKYVIDYFGGIDDLEHKLIKAVGEPVKRFKEDALRILRMVRFASILDFDIDDNTLIGAFNKYINLLQIAKERITTECNKIVAGKGFPKLVQNIIVLKILTLVLPFGTLSNGEIEDKVVFQDKIISIISNKETLNFTHNYLLVYSILFRNKAERNLLYSNLILSNEEKNKLEDIASIIYGGIRHINQSPDLDTAKYLIKRTIKDIHNNSDPNYWTEMLMIAAFAAEILGLVNESNMKLLAEAAEQIVDKNECYSLKQLAINGNDLIELGLEPGPEIKDILEGYLDDVIEGKIENNKEILIEKVKSKIARRY